MKDFNNKLQKLYLLNNPFGYESKQLLIQSIPYSSLAELALNRNFDEEIQEMFELRKQVKKIFYLLRHKRIPQDLVRKVKKFLY